MSHAPSPGTPIEIAPAIQCILAPNPSPMTYQGTNTYLVGERDVTVIDPGPNDPAHLNAILAAVPPGGRITNILVTHSHRDHTQLVPELKKQTNALVLAYGDSAAGRRPDLPERLGGGEGRDESFSPDRCLDDHEQLTLAGIPATALWTPGHMGNHMCFEIGDILFTGDHVMGWATSMVSPPDGDLRAYMTSLEKLAKRPARLYLPGHGAPIESPATRVAELIAHRQAREGQILQALRHDSATPVELTKQLYRDVDPSLWPAATRNVIAHLIDLYDRNMVFLLGPHGPDAEYMLL